MDDAAEISDSQGISRRDAMKRAAMIGGAAFIIPVVTSFSIDKAFAQSTSGGGDSNGRDNFVQGGVYHPHHHPHHH